MSEKTKLLGGAMGKKYRLGFYLMTFCCFLNQRWFLDNLVDAYPQYQDQTEKDNIKKTILEQRCSLINRLIKSFFWILYASLIAFSVVGIFIFPEPIDLTMPRFCGILSILSFSVSTLARLDVGEQTGPGDLPFERLDRIILWTMYFVGTLCGAASFLIP